MPYEILENKSVTYQDFLFKLIIIGDSAVGKSCMLHRLTNNEFVQDHEVTVGVEFGTLLVKLEQQVFKLQIWDTAGQESFKSITKIFYRGAHCIFLTYDMTRLETFNNLATWYNEVMAQSEPDVILFLVGNKKDDVSKRAVDEARIEKFKADRGIQFHFETSALTGENIEQLFITASKVLYNTFKDKINQMVSHVIN
jgi:small GTP-binding protein